MELFLPGLLVFFVAIAISFAIVPKFTPLVVAIVSIVFLVIGVKQHYDMFASEYRLSTWEDSLQIYAPAIMIGAIILFVIYWILSLFTSGSVPVPAVPTVVAPAPESATNQVMESLNSVANTLSNTSNDLINGVQDVFEEVTDQANNAWNSLMNSNENENNNNRNRNRYGNRNKVSKSFFETI